MESKFAPRIALVTSVFAILPACEKDSNASRGITDLKESLAAQETRSRETQAEIDRMTRRIKSLESDSETHEIARKELQLRLAVLEQNQNRAGSPVIPSAAATAKAEPAATSTEAADAGEFRTDILPAAVSNKVVVIEGDQGKGTGFLCTTEGSLWLYTAAHVISGNKSIVVRDQQNNRYKTFDTMEVADGVDLVRLKISDSKAEGLLLEDPDISADIGDGIAAIGNSDGTGVVAVEKGEIRGKGPESWEVSTQIIPGNSGGPVISMKSQRVLGIVTHLLVGKSETWAADTRFAEVRRFAARLDRAYKWTPMTPARFLKEYQFIDAMDDDTKMGWAAITVLNAGPARQSLMGQRDRSRSDEQGTKRMEEIKRTLDWISEAERLVKDNPINPIAAAATTILKRGDRYSAKENIRTLQEVVDRKLVLKDNSVKPEAFSWYHRESYRQSIEWRKRLLERFDE